MPFSNQGFAATRSPRAATRLLSLALTVTFGLAVRSSVRAAGTDTTPTASPKPAAESLHVTIVADGQTKEVTAPLSTVGELLAAQNIHLSKLDRCSLSQKALLSDGATLTITRIRSEDTVEHTAIPFPVKQSYSSTMTIGDKTVKLAGVKGDRAVKYHTTYKDDVPTSHYKLSESVTAPKPQLEVIGTRGMTLASRGYFGGRRIIEMVATGYGPGGNGRWGAHTSSGLKPGFGVVAVDPRFIPLGTRLYIDGYGYAVAGDTGGAIKGNRIDLGRDTNEEAAAEGRKKVRVLVLN